MVSKSYKDLFPSLQCIDLFSARKVILFRQISSLKFQGIRKGDKKDKNKDHKTNSQDKKKKLKKSKMINRDILFITVNVCVCVYV